MSKLTIAAKMSGTGSIYDIASQHEDIELDFDGYEFAVVCPSYYNVDAIMCETEQDALDALKEASDEDYQGVVAIDAKGTIFDNFCDEKLMPTSKTI